jgi:NAD kinase
MYKTINEIENSRFIGNEEARSFILENIEEVILPTGEEVEFKVKFNDDIDCSCLVETDLKHVVYDSGDKERFATILSIGGYSTLLAFCRKLLKKKNKRKEIVLKKDQLADLI